MRLVVRPKRPECVYFWKQADTAFEFNCFRMGEGEIVPIKSRQISCTIKKQFMAYTPCFVDPYQQAVVGKYPNLFCHTCLEPEKGISINTLPHQTTAQQ